MNTAPITLDMQNSINKIYSSCGITSASYSFASLYMWQQSLQLSIYFNEEMFAVKCGFRGENAWFFPCGEKTQVKQFLNTMLKTKNFALYYMSNQDVAFLNEEFAGKFNIKESLNDFEYIYSAQEQRLLNTSSYSKARKLINHIKKTNNITHEIINQSNIHCAMKIANAWLERNSCLREKTDINALETLIANFTQFNAQGVITYIDNIPCSFAIGFFLSPQCFDLAFSKEADKIRGLSTYTRYALISILPQETQTINGEEDLGLEGLRYMKQLMKPIYLLEQYEGTPVFND